MAIPSESFEVQIESPVDFASLNRNGMNLDALIAAQEMFPYFHMLNGPTHVELVKDFWVRAEVYDEEATNNEELQDVIRDPSLKGKSREEMGLETFSQTEIRSALMGVPITITEEIIAKACRVEASGRFVWNITKKHPLLESYTSVVLKGKSSTKLVEIDASHRMLLKFLTECFLQKGGGSDQPSADHKLVLYFLASFNKINLPRYIMHHLCWAIKEGIRSKRKQIPCGRLLSEIFTQGQLVKTLKSLGKASDKSLRTITGKIINGKTLQNMKIINKFSPNEKDLKESTVQTQLVKDFPPILKEKNPEVLNKLIVEFVKETGGIIVDDDTPDVPEEVPLQSRRKRTTTNAGSEAIGAQTKKSKIDKSVAPKQVISSASTKKRGKAESSSLVNQDKLAEAREERAKKMKAFKKKYEGPDFEMIPEKAREAQEQADRMIAARKKEKEALQAARDAKLQSIGIDGSAELYVEKLVEMSKIAETVEQLAVKETEVMLEKIPEALEADASEAAPESASKETQTSALPSPIPTQISLSNDSDHDDIPLGQRMKKLQKPSPKLHQTTQQSTLQEEQTSVVAEGSEDPEEPKTSDLPTCDSPSNLYSLEKHLGGELQETLEKATKSVPEKTELVNQQQQQPEPIKQTTPEQTSTSTQITQTQTTHSPQKAIPEPVVETVVPESVQVTEFEPSVTITAYESIKQPINQTAINDQPSSSSTIQTNQPSFAEV